VNPMFKELGENLRKGGIKLKDIHDLEIEVDTITGIPGPLEYTNKIVGIVEYRDGTIIDVIHQLKEKK